MANPINVSQKPTRLPRQEFLIQGFQPFDPDVHYGFDARTIDPPGKPGFRQTRRKADYVEDIRRAFGRHNLPLPDGITLETVDRLGPAALRQLEPTARPGPAPAASGPATGTAGMGLARDRTFRPAPTASTRGNPLGIGPRGDAQRGPGAMVRPLDAEISDDLAAARRRATYGAPGSATAPALPRQSGVFQPVKDDTSYHTFAPSKPRFEPLRSPISTGAPSMATAMKPGPPMLQQQSSDVPVPIPSASGLSTGGFNRERASGILSRGENAISAYRQQRDALRAGGAISQQDTDGAAQLRGIARAQTEMGVPPYARGQGAPMPAVGNPNQTPYRNFERVGAGAQSSGMTTGGAFGSRLMLGGGPAAPTPVERNAPGSLSDALTRAQETRSKFGSRMVNGVSVNAVPEVSQRDGTIRVVGAPRPGGPPSALNAAQQRAQANQMDERRAAHQAYLANNRPFAAARDFAGTDRGDMMAEARAARERSKVTRQGGFTGGPGGDMFEQYLAQVAMRAPDPQAAIQAGRMLTDIRKENLQERGLTARHQGTMGLGQRQLEQGAEQFRETQGLAQRRLEEVDKPQSRIPSDRLRLDQLTGQWAPRLAHANNVLLPNSNATYQEKQKAQQTLDEYHRAAGDAFGQVPQLTQGSPQNADPGTQPIPPDFVPEPNSGVMVDPKAMPQLTAAAANYSRNPEAVGRQLAAMLNGPDFAHLSKEQKSQLLKDITGNRRATIDAPAAQGAQYDPLQMGSMSLGG